ncbi:TPR repeat region-containing protein [Mycobacteroides abscessus]|uniref:TPR repeat region-containing protein n=1 Tax=Mycobacteroides abscessus TaxID=36809 RepID=UPI0021080EE4|nr:hypothetical protein [Mycobacteroides abscessus]
MSGYSLRRLLENNPENSIEAVRQAILGATQTQLIGRDYKHAIERPGGQEWEGKAARAAQDTAAGDEKVVYRATQHVLDEGPKALDTLAFQVTEHHKRAVGYYNEATSNGYKVSEDITVEWIAPKGAKPETVAEGKRCAAKFQDMIRGEYDKWWAAEEEAAQQIDAIAKELDTSYNPIGGLSASTGHLDGAYLQGGTQWDKDVLGRVQAAATLDDQQLKDLAAGKKVDIGSNRMQYLYQFAHSFDGKSAAEIAAIKAGLPPAQRDAMTRAFALVSNDQVRSGVDNASGVSEATKKNFIPTAGSKVNLPDAVNAELSRTDRTNIWAGDRSGTPVTQMHGVGGLQDVAKIFDGAGGYLNGSEAGRSMLDAATEYTNADIDHRANPLGGGLQTDAHGAPGGVLADQETPLRNALAGVYESAGQDHVDVHEIATSEPTEAEKFLRAVNQEHWGDQSGKVDNLLDWTGDHSQMGAETANAEGHYLADHKTDLQKLPGGGEFAKVNADLANTVAKTQGEYLADYAHPDPSHPHTPGIQAFDRADQLRDLASTLDQGHDSATTLNEAGHQAYKDLLADAARTGSDIDLNAAGRLSQGMLDGAIDSTAPRPDPEDLKAIKDVVGWAPNMDKAFTANDIIEQLQQHGTKLPEGFAQDLAQSGSFGNITAYQGTVLDALAQAHPEIAHDPLVGQYINNGHFDPATIPDGGQADAEGRLSQWFKEVAPRDYNVNMEHWDNQQHQGSVRPNWTWTPSR